MSNNKYYFSVKEDHCSGKKFSDGIPIVLQNDYFPCVFQKGLAASGAHKQMEIIVLFIGNKTK